MSLPPDQPGWQPPQSPEAPAYASQPPAYSSPDHPPAFQSGGNQAAYAGWWARLGALVLDALILMVPIFILGFIVGAVLFASDAGEDDATGAAVVIYALATVLPYVYYGLTMGRDGAHNGQTFGKQIVGIRVKRVSGQPVGFWWAIGRELVKGIIGTVTLLINYLWPLWDKRNQALHDKVMSDVVVKG